MTAIERRQGGPAARVMTWICIAAFACVHILFYVSSLSNDFLRTCYPAGSIQDDKTTDYFQVPNGARSYLRERGTIVGNARPFPTLPNVYHPLMTIVVGGFLQLFDVQTGFTVYTLLKLLTTCLVFGLLAWKYSARRNWLLGSFVLLVFFPQGVEIACGQYHFLLNLLVFLLLYGLLESKSALLLTTWYFLGLLVKPIGLLWLPLFALRKQTRPLLLGALLFVIVTVVCLATVPGGDYYLRFLTVRSVSPVTPLNPGSEAIYSLEPLLFSLSFGVRFTQTLKYLVGIGLLLCFCSRRVSTFAGLFLSVGYYLLFYSYAFGYHYTTLIPFFVLGLLANDLFDHPFAKTWIVISCLPSPYLLFRWLGLFAVPSDLQARLPDAIDPEAALSVEGLLIVVCWRVVPLVMLLGFVVYRAFSEPGPSADGLSGGSADEEPGASSA